MATSIATTPTAPPGSSWTHSASNLTSLQTTASASTGQRIEERELRRVEQQTYLAERRGRDEQRRFHQQRQTLFNELEKAITEINPPEPPEPVTETQVVYTSEDEVGSPYLGDRNFNPNIWKKPRSQW